MPTILRLKDLTRAWSQEISIRVYEILYQLYGYVHVPIGLGSNRKINKRNQAEGEISFHLQLKHSFIKLHAP